MVVALHELNTNRSKDIIELSFYYLNEMDQKILILISYQKID